MPIRKLIFIFSAFMILSSCNRAFNKVLKSNDMDLKAEKADEYFEKKDYTRSLQLYEELLTFFKGQKNVEPYYYNYAMSYYGNKDYLMAGFYFNQFTINFPRSPKAEEAAYKVAECYQKQSPRYELDQTSTIDAINKYQIFINKYPKSPFVEKANVSIDELRLKLHKKAYESAYLYYRIRQYNAAANAFTSLIREFPEMADIEKARYYTVKSLKLYADNSYVTKKLERYNDAVKQYDAFKVSFPNSIYMTELNKINAYCLDRIQLLENKQNITQTDGKEERRN